jgi:[protein-PII] uridylyltransferase
MTGRGQTSAAGAAASRDLRKERLALAVRSTAPGPVRRQAFTALVERALTTAWHEALATHLPGAPGAGVRTASRRPP